MYFFIIFAAFLQTARLKVFDLASQMGFLPSIPFRVCPGVTQRLSQPPMWAGEEEWVPEQQVLPTPRDEGAEWVPLNKRRRQQEEGNADQNAQSSCGNVAEVTPLSAATCFEAYQLWLALKKKLILPVPRALLGAEVLVQPSRL